MASRRRFSLPRPAALFLVLALASGLVWWFSVRPASASEPIAGLAALVLAISAIYGLPMSLLVPLMAPARTEAGCRADLQRALTVFVGGVLALCALFLSEELPTTPWEAAAAPEPMAELLTTLPPDYSAEGLFARGRSGQLYNYDCRTDCTWMTRESPPEPPDRDEEWAGKCYVDALERSGLDLTPPPPQRATTLLPTKYCGVDGSVMTYYLLDDDGMVWTWKRWELGSEFLTLLFCLAPIVFLMGSLAALAWVLNSD